MTYPLDTIRARLAFQVTGEHKYSGIVHTALSVMKNVRQLSQPLITLCRHFYSLHSNFVLICIYDWYKLQSNRLHVTHFKNLHPFYSFDLIQFTGRWNSWFISWICAHSNWNGAVCWIFVLLLRKCKIPLHEIRASVHLQQM